MYVVSLALLTVDVTWWLRRHVFLFVDRGRRVNLNDDDAKEPALGSWSKDAILRQSNDIYTIFKRIDKLKLYSICYYNRYKSHDVQTVKISAVASHLEDTFDFSFQRLDARLIKNKRRKKKKKDRWIVQRERNGSIPWKLGELGLGRKETTERRTSRMANGRPTKWSRSLPSSKTNDSRKRDRFAKRKRVAWVQPANRASPQPVDDKKKKKKRKEKKESKERKKGRGREGGGEERKKSREKKKGRKNRMSQGCLVRFHREGLILGSLNTMGIQSPFFHDNYTRSH